MKTNLNDLHAFIAVVQNGNFTKAASALGSTQSAVSQSVNSLEQNLELKLFHRTTRSDFDRSIEKLYEIRWTSIRRYAQFRLGTLKFNEK